MIFIDGEIHSSKNSRRVGVSGGRMIPFKSRASKADEKNIGWQLLANRSAWDVMIAGKKFPLKVHFKFIRRTKARWDFVNIVQGVADAMVKAGYIPDDDVEHLIPVYGGHEVDKDRPGVLFWVKK